MNYKEQLRREMIEKRKELNIKNGEKFTENIKALPEFKKANAVMLYMPIKGEADVTGILDEDKVFLVPVTEVEEMYASLIGEMEKGSFNVPVPKEKKRFDKEKIDVVIVPGVAFDRKFNRMGFGKGYYDRFLEGLDCFKIGVCHSFQMLDKIPFEKHDVKMDVIITEDKVWRKGNIL
ncbi:MAG: 5-formyltetrahydrofolate cyclo-ligase [Clostridia bacterium]